MRSEWVARTLSASVLLGALGFGCDDGEREVGDSSSSQGGAAAVDTVSGTGGSGTSGEAGAAPMTSSASDTGGAGGAGGEASTSVGGAAGAAGGNGCSFTVDAEVSPVIATVGIVTWSVELEDLDEAYIDFGLSDKGFSARAPVVEPGAGEQRTLLLGMKGEQEYSFRIVAKAGTETCTSDTFALVTGPVPETVPSIARVVIDEEAVAPGFIITATGLGARGEGPMAFIFDSEGDVVWWAPAPGGTGSARMNWEGTEIWLGAVNNGGAVGEMRRMSMDGLRVVANVPGLAAAHHDFTVLPGGSIVTIMHREGGCSRIAEWHPDGTISDVVENVSTLYQPTGDCHPNAIHYHAADDSFTLSDRNPNLFVKFTRSGELIWQFGGQNPRSLWLPGEWQVNHGHQVLSDGHFLFFNNGRGGMTSPVLEFELDTVVGTATQVWSYTAESCGSSGDTCFSGTLGDVQRLPNGNTLITYSNKGVMHEVDPDGNLVQSFEASSLSMGYSTHRPTLYGPPPR